ncbi:MAG TPA: hypothetical protein EYP58_04210 [bacterium (Candidatus Stahlbacteria)]|nr:hypothetical protein [Candidatus Stahlbacteria bacterium]
MAALYLLLFLSLPRASEPGPAVSIRTEDFVNDSISTRAKYLDLGYFDVRIEKGNYGDSILLITYPGRRYLIRDIEIIGSSIKVDTLQDDLGITPGDYYAKADIEVGIGRILDRYLENGFPFCQIKPEMDQLTGYELILRLVINEGPIVNLSGLLYKGKTKTWAIKRWIRFTPGIYNQSRIDEWLNRLENIGYINSVAEKIVSSDPDYLLLIDADELTSEYLEVGGTYSPQGKDLLFMISIAFDNILGTMRQADLYWESSRLFEIRYREPWLFYPVAVSIEFKDAWFDTLRLSRGKLSFKSGLLQVYTGLERGDRQDEFIGIELNSEGGRLQYSGFSEFVRMSEDRSHIKVGGGLVVEMYLVDLRLNGRHTTLSNPEVIDLYQIGGISSLRGYWRDEFYFKTGGWANIEFKPIDIIYPFFDVAQLDRKWYYSTGLGFELMGRNLGLELAIGVPIWEPLKAKIHAKVIGRL